MTYELECEKMKVYIHIGTEKTGTTSIQEYLFSNYENNLKSGILFPESLGHPYHLKITAAARNEKKELDDLRINESLYNVQDVIQYRAKIKDEYAVEIKQKNPKKIIVSNELLSSRLDTLHEVQQLKSILSVDNEDFKVIIYLRRQDLFFLSRYSTKVKFGHTEIIELPKIGNEEHDSDYVSLIKRWESIFGRENIIVRIFEKEKLIDGDVVKDFMSLVEMDCDNGNPQTKIHNKSFGEKKLEFLRIFNKHIPRFIDNKINYIRGDITQQIEKIRIEESGINLNGSEINEYLNRFDEANKWVGKTYFNLNDSPFAMMGKNDDVNSNDLTVDDAIYISSKIWESKQTVILQERAAKYFWEANYHFCNGDYISARKILDHAIKINKGPIAEISKLDIKINKKLCM